MPRYIDADSLEYVGNHIGDEYEDRFHDLQWIYRCDIDKAPTIDAVPVVRCKDCKYRDGSVCDYSAVYVRPNGYCQWGERRDDE